MRLIKKTPSLRMIPAQDLADAYEDARKLAATETGLPFKTFPVDCPYTIEQILNEDWLPA
jgi:hypothetical protein